MYYRVFGSHQDIHHKQICHSRSIFGMDQSSPAHEDHLMTLRNLQENLEGDVTFEDVSTFGVIFHKIFKFDEYHFT